MVIGFIVAPPQNQTITIQGISIEQMAIGITTGMLILGPYAAAALYSLGLQRFLDEARTLARFKHHNVVRVTNFLEANGTAYLKIPLNRI